MCIKVGGDGASHKRLLLQSLGVQAYALDLPIFVGLSECGMPTQNVDGYVDISPSNHFSIYSLLKTFIEHLLCIRHSDKKA